MLALLALGGAAAAQERLPRGSELSVVERVEAGNAPEPIRAGAMVLQPALSLEGSYDSNILAASNNAKGDFFVAARPSLTVQSEWPRNALVAKAEGEFREYASNSSENIGNVAAAAAGRIDLAPNAYVLGGGGYQLQHEDRGALNAVNGIQPTQYTLIGGNAGFVLQPAPLGLRLDVSVDSYGFSNVTASGGAAINETARDRVVYALVPRVSYAVTPQYDAFVRAVVNHRQYNSTRQADGIDRTSNGYAADLGIAFDAAGFAAGEFYVGYLQQDYESRAVKPIQAVDVGANVIWSPSQATSIRLNFARSVEESTLPGAAGSLQTAFRFALEHEVLRNVLLLGSAAYIKAEFPALSGSTDIYEAAVGMRYVVNPNLSAGFEYALRYRSSMAALNGYTRHIVGLRLRGRL